MTWFKVDDQLPDHRKVRRLGRDRLAGVGLWTLAGAWASGPAATDGFVPTEVLVERWDPRERVAARLVEVGLWDVAEVGGEPGYQFHDWPDYNPTREGRERERAGTRERVAKHRREKAAGNPPTETGNGGRNGARNGGRNALQGSVTNKSCNADVLDPGPSRPVPARPGGGLRAVDNSPPPVDNPPPPEQPCGDRHDPERPCRRCGDARHAAATAAAADRDAVLVEAARLVTARRDCRWCDADGRLLEVGRYLPVAPTTSCDHTTPHAEQVATARGRAS